MSVSNAHSTPSSEHLLKCTSSCPGPSQHACLHTWYDKYKLWWAMFAHWYVKEENLEHLIVCALNNRTPSAYLSVRHLKRAEKGLTCPLLFLPLLSPLLLLLSVSVFRKQREKYSYSQNLQKKAVTYKKYKERPEATFPPRVLFPAKIPARWRHQCR